MVMAVDEAGGDQPILEIDDLPLGGPGTAWPDVADVPAIARPGILPDEREATCQRLRHDCSLQWSESLRSCILQTVHAEVQTAGLHLRHACICLKILDMTGKAAFIGKAESILASLLKATNASRTTLRADLPQFGLNVNGPAAEALAPGVHSIKDKTSLDQRNAVAIKWLEKNRRVFVENDCLHTTADVAPEPEVTGVYGIRSEMVAPIIRNDHLIGWVSVHNIRGPHQWTESEIAAIEAACAELGREIGAVEAMR
jgi:GAF domain-containing protein